MPADCRSRHISTQSVLATYTYDSFGGFTGSVSLNRFSETGLQGRAGERSWARLDPCAKKVSLRSPVPKALMQIPACNRIHLQAVARRIKTGRLDGGEGGIRTHGRG
jgi:hypothetical protein